MQKGIDFKETLEKRAFLNKNLKKRKIHYNGYVIYDNHTKS